MISGMILLLQLKMERAAMSDERRKELGEGDSAVEDELHEAFGGLVEGGAERLHRPLRTILITGFFGGLEVGLGVMAYLAVLAQTDRSPPGRAGLRHRVHCSLARSQWTLHRELSATDRGRCCARSQRGQAWQALGRNTPRKPRRRLVLHVADRAGIPSVAHHAE